MGEQTFLGKFMGDVLHGDKLSDHAMGEEKFDKCNERCNSKNFLRSWWETHLKINPYQSIELSKDLSLRLMVNRFQRSCQIQFPSP